MNIANIIFLGTNREQEANKALKIIFKEAAVHNIAYDSDVDLENYDLIFLPGGFSYGDYLRSGALAAKTKIIKKIVKASEKKSIIIGVCNGFQILCEAEILEGALLVNEKGYFIGSPAKLEIEKKSWFYSENEGFMNNALTLPLAHYEGRYFASESTLKQLNSEGRILLRYQDNTNGSSENIACISSKNRRFIGMMPHPENAVSSPIAGNDGHQLIKRLYEKAREFAK